METVLKLNKRGGGDWEPLFIGLFLVLLLSTVLVVFILEFGSVIDDIQPAGVLIPMIDFVDNGIDVTFLNVTFFGFSTDLGGNFNMFDFVPDFFKNFILNSLIVFALIPDIILVPFLILVALGLTYTVLKLMPFT